MNEPRCTSRRPVCPRVCCCEGRTCAWRDCALLETDWLLLLLPPPAFALRLLLRAALRAPLRTARH